MKYVCLKMLNAQLFRSNLHLGLMKRSCYTQSEICKCFLILGVKPNSDQETVRAAFISLVKRYHPDSGGAEADAAKFQEIDRAYKVLQEKFADERWNSERGLGEYGLYYQEKSPPGVQDQDIQHTAPQHRQYLSYGGVGSGTPFQREKQYRAVRTAQAVDSVNTYRLAKYQDNSEAALMERKTSRKAKDTKTGLGIDRLVEDLIQESMAKGEFDNLPGSGKPLKQTASHDNPYVDFITQKMNQVLIDNGFTPAWIMLQKEVRERREALINKLSKERAKLSPLPLPQKDLKVWQEVKQSLLDDVNHLNDKINMYNLMVPMMSKQVLQFDLERESATILKEVEGGQLKVEVNTTGQAESPTLIEFVVSIFHSSRRQ